MGSLIDYTGQTFGRIHVISRASNAYTSGGHPKVRWNYWCDCTPGIIRTIWASELRRGQDSCGCLGKERIKKAVGEAHKKYNEYDLTSFEYGVGYTSKGEPFLFDKEDYDKIKDICWNIHHTGYVMGRRSGDKKDLFLHRVIMDMPEWNGNNLIDHINHDKTDCRKANLRKANYTTNNWNHSIQKNNTNGYPGINLRRGRGIGGTDCYEVYLGFHGKDIYGGRFYDIDEAIARRKEMELQYYGEYAYRIEKQ